MVRGRLPKFSSTSLLWLGSALILGFCLGRSFRGGVTGKTEPISEADPNPTAAAERPADALPPSVFVVNQGPGISAWERLRRLSANETGSELLGCLGLIGELSAAECRKAWDLFRRWPSDERHVVQRAIARRWASLDSEDALQALRSSNDWELWDLLGGEAARVLVQRDPEAALAQLAQGSRGPRHVFLVRHLMRALAETSPARAGAFLLTQPEYLRDDDTFGTVGERWASTDPAAALAWANLIPRGRARSKALEAVWTTWAGKDPAAVAAAIPTGTEHRLDGQVFATVARAWSKADPGAALAWIASLPRKEDRDAAWPSFNLDVRQLGTDAALELLNRIPLEKQRGEVAARVAKELARDNPQEALAWAERLPEGDARAQALQPALAEWAAREPTRAVAYVAGLPPGDSRTGLLRQAVASWAIQDPDAALQWSRRLPAGGERDAVITETASKSLQHLGDPSRAVPWLELVQQPQKREQLVQDLTGHWARLDGAAAAQWLRQLPDAEAQISGHHQVARQWAFEDYDATARWMGSLPSGAARDAAIGGFVDSVDGYDPALATTWAAAIEHPADRDKTIRHAFNRWLERDGTAAWTWLHSADLSQSLRADLVRTSEQRLGRQRANSEN